MNIERAEYKGKPVISFSEVIEGKRPFKWLFGLKKAEIIISNIDEIKKFYDDNKKTEIKVEKEGQYYVSI